MNASGNSRECDCCGSPLPVDSFRCRQCGLWNVRAVGFIWIGLAALLSALFEAGAYLRRRIHLDRK
jgi:hypothetical protein